MQEEQKDDKKIYDEIFLKITLPFLKNRLFDGNFNNEKFYDHLK